MRQFSVAWKREKMKFIDLPLSDDILKAINDAGFSEATPIQQQCIPAIFDNNDIIGQSQTGTGKTAAFVLPLLEKLQPTDHKRPQALILSPTRELAMQISEQIRLFGKYKEGIRTVTVYGGQSINYQIMDLKKGGDIIVGTPGRVLDHIRRKTLRFENCKYLVLDEADEMLQMGFKEELEDILKGLPTERQTSLFSATMPQAILNITKKYLTNPNHISIAPKQKTITAIQQLVYEVANANKIDLLLQVLHIYQPQQVMIFCNTKKMVDDVADALGNHGFNSAAIHGDMRQEMRTGVMAKFKKGQTKILIATDVAARGIDIDQLDLVVNYDLPMDDEYYIHRIGRTGRAGSDGIAITFINSKEHNRFTHMIRNHKLDVAKLPLPTQQELDQLATKKLMQMVSKQSNLEVSPAIKEISEQLLQQHDAQALVETLLNQLTSKQKFSAIKPLKNNNTGSYKTYIINIGSKQGYNARKFLKTTNSICGIDEKHIGDIRIKENQTQFQVADFVELETIHRLEAMDRRQPIIITQSNERPKGQNNRFRRR